MKGNARSRPDNRHLLARREGKPKLRGSKINCGQKQYAHSLRVAAKLGFRVQRHDRLLVADVLVPEPAGPPPQP